jgi:hypothetical protein
LVNFHGELTSTAEVLGSDPLKEEPGSDPQFALKEEPGSDPQFALKEKPGSDPQFAKFVIEQHPTVTFGH